MMDESNNIKSEEVYQETYDDSDESDCPKKLNTSSANLLSSNFNTPSSSTTITDWDPTNRKFDRDTGSILFREYFHLLRMDGTNIETECQLCLPNKKTIKGSKFTTTNFIKHLRRMHPESFVRYGKDKVRRSSKTSFNYSVDDNCVKQRKIEGNRNPFENRLIKFLINTMSPLSIIENESFVNLFEGTGIEMITKESADNIISEMYQKHVHYLTATLKKQMFLCTTWDVWSYRHRTYIGVSCHWIRDDYIRESAVLYCERFSDINSYKNIAEKLRTIITLYDIQEESVVATMTDNGSKVADYGEIFHQSIDQSDIDVVQFQNINETLEEDFVSLAKHKGCANHILTLIVTTDLTEAIEKNSAIKSVNMESMDKIYQLWDKAILPESSEIIKNILGLELTPPNVTSWNSFYHGMKRVLSEKLKLQKLTSKLKMKRFTETELNYLEDYCTVMGPVAATLDLLQGETNMFYGIVLPTLISLKNKLEKAKNQILKGIGVYLLKTIKDSFTKRFSDLLALKNHDAIIASVVHPQFKFRWYSDNPLNELSIKEIEQIVLKECAAFYTEDESRREEPGLNDYIDDFYDFNEEQAPSTTTTTSSLYPSKVELEFLQYLEDPRRNLTMLDTYPLVKKVFLKFNTCLPSSVPVERLFQFDTLMDPLKQREMTDEHFEKLVFLKLNKVN